MKFVTERFGELEINQEEVLSFPKGMLGFTEEKKYVLIPADDKQETPFSFLQSVEEGELCFVVLDTFSFFKEYDFELDEATLAELEIEKPEDVLVFTMVTIKDSLKEATTNLKAPLIINSMKRRGKQVILEKGDYLIKQPLFDPHPKTNLSLVKG
jgi:flagellar assembly factor FliW